LHKLRRVTLHIDCFFNEFQRIKLFNAYRWRLKTASRILSPPRKWEFRQEEFTNAATSMLVSGWPHRDFSFPKANGRFVAKPGSLLTLFSQFLKIRFRVSCRSVPWPF